MPAFGQTAFGQRIWPNRIWPELVFLVFWPCVCVCVCFKILGVFKMFGGCLQDFGASPLTSAQPECPLPRTATSTGPLRRTAQIFALSFISLPPEFFFLLSLGSLFVEFWWCF